MGEKHDRKMDHIPLEISTIVVLQPRMSELVSMTGAGPGTVAQYNVQCPTERHSDTQRRVSTGSYEAIANRSLDREHEECTQGQAYWIGVAP